MSLWPFVCSVLLCSLWEKICHSSFVIMSFCLKNHTCLSPSLCYSVFKTTPSVTPVLMLLCLQNYPVSFVFMLLCLKELSCLPPSPCYSVFKKYLVWLLILLHISCLRSAFLCCTFASSSGMKTVTGWASDDRRGWGGRGCRWEMDQTMRSQTIYYLNSAA